MQLKNSSLYSTQGVSATGNDSYILKLISNNVIATLFERSETSTVGPA